ncbi:MAG: hypothetical protein J1E95_02035 [Muribaculaceae bacterium]|nr:hypothetical protein [Muribaculaceae bacterium]
MKYFYGLIVSAVALSASAINTVNHQLNVDFNVKKELQTNVLAKQKMLKAPAMQDLNLQRENVQLKKEIGKKQTVSPVNATKNESARAHVLRAKKVDSSASVEGLWTFQMGDYYFESSANTSLYIDYEASFFEGNYLAFQDPTGAELPFFGYYDQNASTITFDIEVVGEILGHYIVQMPYEYSYELEDRIQKTVIADYNASAGTLSFEPDNGIAWILSTDQNGSNNAGYFNIFDFEGAVKSEGGNTGGGNTGGGSVSGDIEGTWEFEFGDYYFEDSVGYFTLQYEAVLQNGNIIFQDPSQLNPPFVGSFNSNTNIMSFERLYLGVMSPYYLFMEPYLYDSDEDGLVATTSFTGIFDPESNTIEFPEEGGLIWAAYSNQSGSSNELVSYLAIYDFLGASKVISENDIDENWIGAGMATLMDGWVLPAFGIDQMDEKNHYQVPLQQNINNKNLYRLVDPYKYGPIAAYNESTSVGHIVFDVTDPQHVVFEKAEAGFANSEKGILKFYCYNMLGAFMATIGCDAKTAMEMAGNQIPYTKFEDGVISLNYVQNDGQIQYDANFGYQNVPTGLYLWTTPTGASSNMTAKIYMPSGSEDSSVNALTKEEGNARYFNLQGVEIQNPNAGEIYIKVTGSRSEKVMMK